MAVQQGTTSSSGGSRALIIGGAVLVALLIVAYFVWANVMPKNTTVIAPQSEKSLWLTQKAKESQGNFQSLSPADQAKADQLTSGKGAYSITMAWQVMQRSGQTR